MDAHSRFLSLFLHAEADLRAFLRSVVADRAAVDDLLQESALALWRNFDAYDPSRPFGAWARGVAWKKVLQERARRVPLAFSPAAVQAVLDAYDRTEAAAPDFDALRDCLAKLPERARQLIALRYEQSLKLAEIARRAGSTLDAVHKLLSRAREALQQCLERSQPT